MKRARTGVFKGGSQFQGERMRTHTLFPNPSFSDGKVRPETMNNGEGT